MNDCLDYLREKAAKLPLKPGVYLMKGKSGKIIYVGKAKQLKNRVSTYFIDTDTRDFKTEKLVEHIQDFDYIVTLIELDALVLESSLIKQHRPKYNILLKDARGLNYVKISPGDYPRLTYAHNNEDKACKYIGPYAVGFSVRQSVIDVNRIFMLPSCGRKFPQEFGKSRPCLNYRIERCIGVCRGEISADEYKQRIKSAIDYIKKGSKESVRRLTAEMNVAAETLDFEKAARIRDQISAIKRVDSVKQSVQSSKTIDYHVIGLSCNMKKAAVAIVKYSGGRLFDKESFYLGDVYEEAQMLRDFLLEYYSGSNPVPREVYLETNIVDKALLEEHLKVKITIPKRGEGLSQVMLAKNNAAEYLALKIGRASKELAALEEVANLLGLTQIPEYIECYDISNIGESVKVGGMVVYRNGKPFKKGYRKFTIKDVSGLDDYACMREVVRRRFIRYIGKDSGFSQLPDLILLDGGVGHVSTVKSVLEELGLTIPLFGLVKDSRHKTRAIAATTTEDTNAEDTSAEDTNAEIQIQSNKSVFAFLTKIQEEVHRFSVTFAREKHKKNSFTLSLTGVPGIGEAKAAALLKQFKTKQALKSATNEELRSTAKISTEKAQELKQYIMDNM